MAARETPFLLNSLTVIFCTGAVIVVLYFGNVQRYDDWLYDHDCRFWYSAGKAWLQGESPYNFSVFSRMWISEFNGDPRTKNHAFVYPPAILIIGIPLSLLPWDTARVVFRLLSVFSFFGSCILMLLIMSYASKDMLRKRSTWMYCAMCCLLFSVMQTMFQGQTPLLVMFGIMLLVYGWQRGLVAACILGCLFASLKPQMSFFFILYVFFAGGHKKVLAGAAVVVIITALLLVSSSTHTLFQHMLHSLTIHRQQGFNDLNQYDCVTGLFGAAAGGPALFYGGIFVGVAVVILLARGTAFRPTAKPGLPVQIRHLQLIAALTVGLMPLHRYDAVAYVLVVGTLGFIHGTFSRLVLLCAVLVHGAVWRLTGYYARIVLGFTDDQIFNPLEFHYWLTTSHLASLFSGIVLFLIILYFFRDRKHYTTP